MKKVFWIGLVILGLVLRENGEASTIYVDDDNTSEIEDGTEKYPYRTIQEGIDACSDFGTVCVRPGIYTGTGNKNLTWKEKHIIVKSQNGPLTTIIDCEKNGRGFYFNDTGQNSNDIMDGFTIKNGNVAGEWPENYGGGIYCGTFSPSIINCIITQNSASTEGAGGGIACLFSSPIIIDCIVIGNKADYFGGGIVCSCSSPTITNCIIRGNSAVWGGGIHCRFDSSPTITNSTIMQNIAGGGGGIYCVRFSSPTITNCVIIQNMANFDGAGVNCYYNSSPTIINCVITGNIADRYSGGIYCSNNSSPCITNCIITQNSRYGIYEADTTSDPLTNYNCFYNNTPSDYYDEGLKSRTVKWLNIKAGFAGNISSDPKFIGNGDYHLQSISPCIDKGLNTASGISLTDKDGNPRIINGIVDIGVYECKMEVKP
ncbi:MAG: right-handed parallel beta-helix repeat-containing protein [bacterium]